MKKNLLSILALGGLLFASSCQMDEPDAGTLTGEVDFSRKSHTKKKKIPIQALLEE